MTSHSGVEPTGTLLPTEVFLEIFRYLGKDDLKSVRLVSRSCSHWVSSLIFNTVYISAHKEDLDAFISLATHPHLSKCVRRLKYDASQFASDLSKRDYLWLLGVQIRHNLGELADTLRRRSDPEINGLVDFVAARSAEWSEPVTKREALLRYGASSFVEDGHQKYLDYSSRQEATKHDKGYWETVARGMSQFENLESGETYAGWYPFGSRGIGTLKYLPYGDSFQTGSPLQRSWNPVHLRPFGGSRLDISSDLETSDGTYEFAMMNQFMKWAPHPLKRLDMGGRFLSPMTLDVGNKTCTSLLAESFRTYARMETLILFIEHGEQDEDARYYPMPGLITLLDSAIHLKLLDLTLPINSGFYEDYYKLPEIFPMKHVLWPNLETFAIGKISFDATYWMTLLHFKMPKLRCLKVDEIELAEGSWEEVIECMSHRLELSYFYIGNMGLLYSDQRLFWARGVTREGRNHSSQNRDLYSNFLRDIRNYVVRGGRHPCLKPEQPGDAFHVGSEQLFSSAQSLMQHGERVDG